MHDEVLKCCQPDEKESYEDSFGTGLKNFEEFKDRYSQWRSAILSLEECAQSSMGDSVKSASTTSSSSRSRLAQARLRKLKAQRQLRRIDELFELEQAERDILRRKQIFYQRRKCKMLKTKRRFWQMY